jgi:carbonic anhydrase
MKLNAVALVLASLSLQACTPSLPGFTGNPDPWNYQGSSGPERWGDLQPAFAKCKLGQQQSPIDVRYPELAALRPIDFNYGPGTADVMNNGHTIQVSLNGSGSIRLGATDYKLVQFHFHTPGETRINGNSFPMSAQLVHKSNDGKVAVVEILYMVGNENLALKAIFDSLPTKEGEKKSLERGLNANHLLPASRSYYGFRGSLTTPPCTEDVLWLVIKQPLEISAAQLAAFQKLYPMNARPVQPLNGRKVFETL